jgi:hypothetical protein
MGAQADSPGDWYLEDQNPSIRAASSRDYRDAVGDAEKVCARIANSRHRLAKDAEGGYATGNCVPIERTGTAPSASETSTSATTAPSEPTHSGHGGARDPTGEPTTAPTPTPDPTDDPTSPGPKVSVTKIAPASAP